MRLSDKFVLDIIQDSAAVENDGEFDKLCLLGKRKVDQAKSLTYLSSKEYIEQFFAENHYAVICTPEIAENLRQFKTFGILVTKDPKSVFFKIHNYLVTNTNHYGKDEPTSIKTNCNIHEKAVIANENVFMGNNVTIGANVIIHEGVFIEDNAVIMDGCIIGAPAFYYFGDGINRQRVESSGSIKIGKNVMIHPNTVICKGVLGGKTVIGDYTALDSDVFIGHDVNIGMNCTLAAGSKLAGWVHIGDNCFIGVGGKIAPNVIVSSDTKISIGAVVTKNVEPFTQVSGNFAIPHKYFIKNLKHILQNEGEYR